MVATQLDTDMSPWGPGVRHYALDDGTYIAVSVDAGVNDKTKEFINEALAAMGVPSLQDGEHRIIVEPTVIVAVDEHGQAQSLDRLYEFPPGTSFGDALKLAGYQED